MSPVVEYDFSKLKCFSPINVVDRQTGEVLARPCGKCLPCLRRKQSEWIVRLKEQINRSDPSSCYFVTLTYSDEFVPVMVDKFHVHEDLMTLDKRDFIAFFRRMRSLVDKAGFIWHDPAHELPDQAIDLERSHFKYYCTTEYGPVGKRPHAHIIFFDLQPDKWKVELLCEKCWPYGFVSVYPATVDDPGFIGYVTKYLVNNMLSPSPMVAKPFSLMSKGLGLSYIERMEDWHRADVSRRFSALPGGSHDILPRYWRDQLYTASQRAIQAEVIRQNLDREADRVSRMIQSDEDLVKFQEAKARYISNQNYANLQVMLKKHKIK